MQTRVDVRVHVKRFVLRRSVYSAYAKRLLVMRERERERGVHLHKQEETDATLCLFVISCKLFSVPAELKAPQF